MTDYERGYTDGYKDGLHKFIPEVASIPIPQVATERQARIEALEQVREKIAVLDMGRFLHLDRFISLHACHNTILNIIDEAIAAERTESAKPELGDVVAWVFPDGDYFLEQPFYEDQIAQYNAMENAKAIVLMRAADVHRKIEEASS